MGAIAGRMQRMYAPETEPEAVAPVAEALPAPAMSPDPEATAEAWGDSPELDAARASVAEQADAVSGADAAVEHLGHAMLGGGTHTVAAGETLRSIARRTYGSASYATDLAAFNADVGKVKAGVELAMPKIVVPLLPAMVTFEADEARFLDVVTRQSATEWATFLANLPQDTYDRHAPMLARAELFRTTGMSTEEMATVQMAHFEREASESGTSVADAISSVPRDKTGYTGTLTDEWADATKEQRALWDAEFPGVRDAVIEAAPPSVKDAIALAKQHGGGEVIWAPERMGAGAIARSLDWNMRVGLAWMKDAKIDPARVYSTFLHEMVGHPEYASDGGDYLAGPIMAEVMDQLPEDERGDVKGKPIVAYQYFETEIFAELYEWPLDHIDAPNDHAFERMADGTNLQEIDGEDNRIKDRIGDVQSKLEVMREAFAPQIVEGIVRGLWIRIERNEAIAPRAKEMFAEAVSSVLGMELDR